LTSAFYTALQEGGQVELPRHTDGGDISFMIALSGSNDYEGERERERENTLIRGGAMIALSGSNDYEGEREREREHINKRRRNDCAERQQRLCRRSHSEKY